MMKQMLSLLIMQIITLVISGGATKTLSGSTNVGGDLTVTATSTVLAVGGNTIDVNGTNHYN